LKRVLVTGGTGFIGANLARHLLAAGHQVHLLVRPGYQSWRIDSIHSDCQIHELRFQDIGSLEKTLKSIRPDWIFHLATHGAYSWQQNVVDIVQTNFVETVYLVEACLKQGFEAFIHAGSSSEYGLKNHAPSEDEWLEPNSYYAVTKASASLYCRFIAQHHRAPLSVLRLYSAYGPYEQPGRLVPALIVQGLAGKYPPLAQPEISRDFVFVEDVIRAFILAAAGASQCPGAVYNIGTGLQTSLRQIVATIQRLLNIAEPPDWGSMPARAWDTSVWVANPHKAQVELGWQPMYNLENGLRLTIDWFQNHPGLINFYRRPE
jgi:nucleoside-diphosphate-sugar epimerase